MDYDDYSSEYERQRAVRRAIREQREQEQKAAQAARASDAERAIKGAEKMTGIKCLQTELLKRGCTKSQIQSRVVSVVLDVVAGNVDKYAKAWDDENELDRQKVKLHNEIACIENAISSKRRQLEQTNQEFSEMKSYINDFCTALKECETPEGRDAMRRAQMFVNSVDVDSKYDNTAFIIGLAAILSEGKCGALEELKKINPKLFSSDRGTWI